MSLFVELHGIRIINLGWDDNWRSGAIIKKAKMVGIVTNVYQHGLVADANRYIPYSDNFYFFEENFEEKVGNIFDVNLRSFVYISPLRNLAFSTKD